MRVDLPPIGQYSLQQRLKRDGASEVWRAYDTDLQRVVLLKFFYTDLSHTSDALAGYVRSVERVAALRHPNIVPIHDVHVLPSRQTNGSLSLLCLTTQYVEGPTFADYIRNTSALGKLPPATEVIALFTAIAQALDLAHHYGVIHGNLKPGNILFEQTNTVPGKMGTPLLTDFGQTKFLPNRSGTDIPSYLSPEQIKGTSADERSDIYALGVMLYELYTGVLPFQGKRPIAVMMQHVSATPTPPDLINPTISPSLTQVILRCLAKDPQERFPNVASLVVALADALHVPTTGDLRRSALQAEAASPPPTSSRPLPPISPTPAPLPPTLHTRRRSSLSLATIITLLFLLSAGLVASLLLTQRSAPTTQMVGHAFFLNSGQFNGSSSQGLNDEIQVDLSNLPDPATGKSYYAWLLGDTSATEIPPLSLGRLTLAQNAVHFVYAGDGAHANLLGTFSRFLITEDDAQHPASDPLLDQSTWRYYGIIPQTPSPADKLHFSMLDHMRHLLVESPELVLRGLHGGLAFWLSRNTAIASNLAHSLADDWQTKDPSALRTQLIALLDYLDGSASIGIDVPSNTPLLAPARDVQVALLGPAPQNTDPPGYVYQNEAPPGYIYLLETHINGAILSPSTTPDQRQLAIAIIKGTDAVKQQFTQIYQDAKQLLGLSNSQLLASSTLTTLDDLATQAQYAYAGRPDPSTGGSQGGVLWIYTNIQRLATFTVAPYVATA